MKANLQKAHAVSVEMIMGHHKIQPSARAKRAAGLSSNAELCTKSDSDMEHATMGTKHKNNKSSSNPQKKSWTSQPAPKKAAHNSSFTPATDQPMDLNTDDADAESQQDETDVGEVGDEADAYERLCTVRNSE